MTAFDMVREFLHGVGKNCPDVPTLMIGDTAALWDRLDEEETREYHEARRHGDLGEIAKELADRIYILLGHAVTLGLTRFDDIFAEVHRSNMSKIGTDGKPVLRDDGKVLKGENFTPPDIRSLVRDMTNSPGDC